MKRGITFIELLLFIAVIFILSSIGSVFIGCSDNGVSSEDTSTKLCNYTIRYYHPNVDEVIHKVNLIDENFLAILLNSNSNDGWHFQDLYNRVITNDTTIYENVLWTDYELNEHLKSNFQPSDSDKVHEILDETNIISYLLNELEKREGELLNTSCHDAKYVTDEDYWI